MVQVLALIGLVGECQLSQLLPGRGWGGGGVIRRGEGLGAGLTIPLKLEQRRLDGRGKQQIASPPCQAIPKRLVWYTSDFSVKVYKKSER